MKTSTPTCTTKRPSSPADFAWNHPLPDGNKRAAWACLIVFIDLNGGHWDPDPPDVDDAVHTMLEVAARDVDEAWLANWLRQRVRFTK